MKLIIVTSSNTKHVLPIQTEQMFKYGWLETFRVNYVEHKQGLKLWCRTIADFLEDFTSENIVLGLDDFIPIDYPDPEQLANAKLLLDFGAFQRVELNWGGAKHREKVARTMDGIDYFEFTKNHPYTVSTQFSMWHRPSLIRILREVDGDPWDFEKKGRANACALASPALRYIEESMLSNRKPGRFNVLGLSLNDQENLVRRGYLEKSKMIYGWKGQSVDIPIEKIQQLAGEKYRRYYQS